MKEPITTKRVIIFFITAILPILSIALGCFLLVGGMLCNTSFLITYIAIPIISIALLALLMFSNRGVVLKIILTIFILLAFIFSFVATRLFGTFEMLSYNSENEIGDSYVEVCEYFDSMPTLDELGDYEKVKHYDYFSTVLLIFNTDADTLVVQYDSDEYQKQKALLDSKYVFQEEILVSSVYTCQPSFTIGDYSFRALSIDEQYSYNLDYPKRMVFIATNDQDNSISYTAFYDDDLDYIESLEEFLLNDCGWKHIIK